LLQLNAFHQRLLEQSNATQRRQPGSIFVAALAHAAASALAVFALFIFIQHIIFVTE